MQPSAFKNTATTLHNLMSANWRKVTDTELYNYGLHDTGDGKDISSRPGLRFADLPDPRPGEKGDCWAIRYMVPSANNGWEVYEFGNDGAERFIFCLHLHPVHDVMTIKYFYNDQEGTGFHLNYGIEG